MKVPDVTALTVERTLHSVMSYRMYVDVYLVMDMVALMTPCAMYIDSL